MPPQAPSASRAAWLPVAWGANRFAHSAQTAKCVRKTLFLLAILALGFYNVGMICVTQADVFPSWRLLDFETF